MTSKDEEIIKKRGGSMISPCEKKAISDDVQKLQPLSVFKTKAETKEEIKLGEKKDSSGIVKEILCSIRGSVDTYISLADAKAGFLLGISAGILTTTYLYGPKIFTTSFHEWKIPEILASIGILLLCSSICFSLFTVWPRMRNSKRKGLFSWVHVANYEGAKEYLRDLESANEAKTVEGLCELNYDLSVICREKYRWLSLAFACGLIGIIICIGTLVF